MRITGYVFCILALIFYLMIWQAIWHLVSKSREIEPDKQFSRFWWLPAWRVHTNRYPTSNLRRKIVMLFILTFALLCVGMVCIGYSMFYITE